MATHSSNRKVNLGCRNPPPQNRRADGFETAENLSRAPIRPRGLQGIYIHFGVLDGSVPGTRQVPKAAQMRCGEMDGAC